MENYFLGIDVSKGYADFIILDSQKQTVENEFQLDDTFVGHGQLYKVLKELFARNPKGKIYAGVESTGGYENNWYHTLHKLQKDFPIWVTRINPLGISHYSKAALKRVTTDKISARTVAEYLMAHDDKVEYEQQDYFATIRREWKFVALLIKQKTQLLNQLESLLYVAQPQVLKYCRRGIPQWVLKLIRRYPTALQLSRARVTSIARIPYITMKRAQRLVAEARATVASATDEVMVELIPSLVAQIQHLHLTIERQTDRLVDHCQFLEVVLLKTFKGISDYSAVGLLIEIGAIQRFPTVKHLASFFGIHPVYKASGDGIYGIRMSKQGRKQPRQILFNVALAAISKNPHIRQIYDELVQRGMNKMAAVGVIMHKILRIVYGMLKNRQPYWPEIDQANRATVPEWKESLKEDKGRRYQAFDKDAPISRRQMKKRKERAESHNDNIIKSGIILPAQKIPKFTDDLDQQLQKIASTNQ